MSDLMISVWTEVRSSRLHLVPCSWNSLFYSVLQRTLLNLYLSFYNTLNLPWSLLRDILWRVCMIFRFTSSMIHVLCMGSLAHRLGYLDVFAKLSCQAYVWSGDVICTKSCLKAVIFRCVFVFIRAQSLWRFAKRMYDLMIWHCTEITGKRRDLFFVFQIIPAFLGIYVDGPAFLWWLFLGVFFLSLFVMVF